MIIIFEGPDGTGKTQAAQLLARTIGAEILSKGPPKKRTWWEEYINPLSKIQALNSQKLIVCDRWHLGEMVWPDIYGRKTLFCPKTKDFQRCCKILHNMQCILVVFRRSEDGIINEILSRGESNKAAQDAVRSIRLFEKAAKCAADNMNVVFFDGDAARKGTLLGTSNDYPL